MKGNNKKDKLPKISLQEISKDPKWVIDLVKESISPSCDFIVKAHRRFFDPKGPNRFFKRF